MLIAGACEEPLVDWTEPVPMAGATLEAAFGDSAGAEPDDEGAFALSATPADGSRCAGSLRFADAGEGRTVAAWWSLRSDRSVVLRASLAERAGDGVGAWSAPIAVDTTDVGSEGCDRAPPSIAASGGFVHLAYSVRAPEGAGVFYAHSMSRGASYEPPVPIVYGEGLVRAAVAADLGLVAVAFEDPNDPSRQIGLALSREWGHLFLARARVTTGISGATDPAVAVRGGAVAVSWRQGGRTGGPDARMVRVGRVR